MVLTPAAMQALEAYEWPGNVREMENVIERCVALTDDQSIDAADLPANISGLAADNVRLPTPKVPEEGLDMPGVIGEIERAMIAQAMAKTEGVKARAAALLGINRTTLVEKMKRYGI